MEMEMEMNDIWEAYLEYLQFVILDKRTSERASKQARKQGRYLCQRERGSMGIDIMRMVYMKYQDYK